MNYTQGWRNLRAKQCEELERKAEQIQWLESIGEGCFQCKHCIATTPEPLQCELHKKDADTLCLDFELYGDPEIWGEE